MIKKRFLLTAGDSYYPSSGSHDWIGFYETIEDAESMVEKTKVIKYYNQGKNKGAYKSIIYTFSINGDTVDWYEIIDIMDWQ
jgi:hypothetical protein